MKNEAGLTMERIREIKAERQRSRIELKLDAIMVERGMTEEKNDIDETSEEYLQVHIRREQETLAQDEQEAPPEEFPPRKKPHPEDEEEKRDPWSLVNRFVKAVRPFVRENQDEEDEVELKMVYLRGGRAVEARKRLREDAPGAGHLGGGRSTREDPNPT